MLDKLVESKNNGKDNKRFGGFFVTTFMTVGCILAFGLIYSLFSQTLSLGSGGLEVSSLVAPVADNVPTPPEPEQQVRPRTAEKTASNMPTRMINMQRADETPIAVPNAVSVNVNKYQSRPKGSYTLGKSDSMPPSGASFTRAAAGSETGTGLTPTEQPEEVSKKVELEKPPVIKQAVKPEAEKIPPTISGGVVNGKATNLVKPIYSSAARVMRIGGEVKVQVTIDEDGRVISAKSVSGHPLLRSAAETAAKSSRFTPTTLSKQKVKVTGVIIYNFAVQ